MKLPDLMRSLALDVRQHVQNALQPILARLGELDSAVKAIPAGPKGDKGDSIKGDPGQKGDKGDPGDSIKGDSGQKGDKGDPGDSIKGDPGSKGDKGDKGDDGKSVAGKDGRDGRDGKDGAPGRDALDIEPLPSLDEAKSYPRGTWASHNGGLLKAIRDTDPLQDKTPGEAGWRVVVNGIAALVVAQSEDSRKVIVSSILTSGETVARAFDVPGMIYRGVYSEKVKYVRGDTATWAGSTWHCDRNDPGKPGEPDCGWTLCVKRGRDGK